MPIPYNNIQQRLDTLKDYCDEWSKIFATRKKNMSNFHLSQMLDAFKESLGLLETELDIAGGFGADNPGGRNLPRFEQTQIMHLIENDWDIISRICIQRLFLPDKKTSDDLPNTYEQVIPKKNTDITEMLQHADQQALDFYHAFNGFRTNAMPLVLFDKAFHITRYKLTPYPLIGVPFSFRDREMQPQAIAHEVGHYIYSHSNDPEQNIKASTMLYGLLPEIIETYYDKNETSDRYTADDHVFRKKLLTKMISLWLEEIMADIFGALLSGPSYIDTSINMTITRCMSEDDSEIQLDEKRLRENDFSHPAPYLRPFIATKTLSWVSEFMKDEEESSHCFDYFVSDRELFWGMSLSSGIGFLSDTFQNEKQEASIQAPYKQEDDEADLKNGLVPHSLTGSAYSAMEYLVQVILEGFKRDDGTGMSTWHIKGEDTGVFGIGHLINPVSLKAIFETVLEHNDRPEYKSFMQFNLKDESGSLNYTPGIPAHPSIQMPDTKEKNGFGALIEFAREQLGIGEGEQVNLTHLTQRMLGLIKSNQSFLESAILDGDPTIFVEAPGGIYILSKLPNGKFIAKEAALFGVVGTHNIQDV